MILLEEPMPRGENRKKTARITFYKNDEDDPSMWVKNSVEQPLEQVRLLCLIQLLLY